MIKLLDPLRELTMASLFIRLLLAMFFGGMIGMERGLHGRAAGLRTYMLVCVGAATAVILSQYEYLMLGSLWKGITEELGVKVDVSRYGAQVINGIGFLGAGTILVTAKKEVKGLTTAASLWASGCMGLAIGAGFYECALLGFGYVFLSDVILHGLSEKIAHYSRKNMNIYVEFTSPFDIREIMKKTREMGIAIYNVDLESEQKGAALNPSAEILMCLPDRGDRQKVLETLADLECVRLIDEI